jgi:hypothetical protein
MSAKVNLRCQLVELRLIEKNCLSVFSNDICLNDISSKGLFAEEGKEETEESWI